LDNVLLQLKVLCVHINLYSSLVIGHTLLTVFWMGQVIWYSFTKVQSDLPSPSSSWSEG